ncbi:hypothetical protein [Enterococcus dispar]|mgnify:CR=1 FL=1|uniref:hypothetical protein n=1 Tax=Enterococcus dispar TaxID=44009 RepID=UPI00189F60CC|nr:hypothetical protein [Enterococcus dispar]
MYSAVLLVPTNRYLVDVTIDMIVSENSRQWQQATVIDNDGNIIADSVKPVWSGNYVSAYRKGANAVEVVLMSRTLQNIKDTVADYKRVLDAELVSTNYDS